MKFKTILACVLWGSAFAGAKIAFQYVPPIFLSGARFMLAGLMLIPVILIKKENISGSLKHWPFMLFFAFVQSCLQYGLFFMGLSKVPGAISAIIIGAGPLFVAIMAHLTMPDDKMSWRKIFSIALGLSGIVFISLSQGEIIGGGSSFYIGVGFLLMSNIIGSYTNIMVAKRKSWQMSPLVLTSFANFVGGSMLLILSFIFERPDIKIYPAEFYFSLIWLSIIPAVAFSLWYGMLQQPGVKVSELNMWKFIVPITGCILSWLLLPGEVPTITSVTGIIIITVALQLQHLPKKIREQ